MSKTQVRKRVTEIRKAAAAVANLAARTDRELALDQIAELLNVIDGTSAQLRDGLLEGEWF